ncbi:MAG: minichromosome maintenance protein MCM [Nitrosopumilus sp.]|nr:minichromosome maintenance protein MCM [Nitrosopumilus sp.]
MTDSALTGRIRDFLNGFRGADGRHKYVLAVDAMVPRRSKHIVLDYNDLVHEKKIVSVLVHDPDRALEAFSKAIHLVLKLRYPKYAESIQEEIRVRIANYPLQRSLRRITADTIGSITSVSGMVVRASEVKPLAKELIYVCSAGHTTKVIQSRQMEMREPLACIHEECKQRDLELRSDASTFIDFQILRLQELPEDLPPGQLPHYIDVTIRQDLVDNARPGDRIVLTGVVRIEQEPVPGVARANSGLYRLRIEGNNIEFLGGRGSKTSRKIEREEISPEEEQAIIALGQSPDIYQRLIDSFAPHIRGHPLVKESILLLMIGAMQKQLSNGTRVRGDINVFLVGDPGTAKSEMLKFCARIAPRGLYTSGRGSTAAGLTAAVVKDKSGIMMLEAGAVVLGDQGIVSIDEFDKMQDNDRSALHEVMEQQSASIAKGGIVATLNARTSILAAANPLYGKYDVMKNITENINLPIPLLTRFDLIFIIRDSASSEKDEEIARHIIDIHGARGGEKRPAVDPDLLTKYIAYAKRLDPPLTKEAEDVIVAYYLKMRKADRDAITITPRQLEGLVRLATARARLLLKESVEGEDADRAVFLVQSMLQEAGIDVNTGEVDMGVLHGRPRSELNKIQLFMTLLRELEAKGPGKDAQPGSKPSVSEIDLVKELTATNKFTEDEARSFIAKMKRDGTIYEPHPGRYATV